MAARVKPRSRMLKEFPDGIIKPDSAVGKALGFTSDKFEGWLWKIGNRVMISMIVSRREGKGNLSALFGEIERRGLLIAVPTPFAHMVRILAHKGFKPHYETGDLGRVEVWSKP